MKTMIVKGRMATPRAEPCDFAGVLRAELARRCCGNPRYSLRSFARWLGVDHATLSQLLRGRRTLTAAMIRRLGARLKLDVATIESHVAAMASRPRSAAGQPSSLDQMRQLTADAACLAQEWHHFAILELTRLESFKPDSRWIARVLGIRVDEVNIALQQLIRLGLLEMVSATRWVDRSGDAALSVEGLAHVAVQRLAQRTRAHIVRAIAGMDSGACDLSATTLAISSARLPEMIERIARFRQELLAMLEGDARRDDVYQLEINFFPLTRLSKDEFNARTRHAMADALEQAR